MYKLCKTEQSAARQRQLEEGLLRAISAHRYEDLSVSDLCAQLDIPRKSFYRYFSSKEGALHALLDHTLMAYETYAPKIPGPHTLHKELSRFFLFWQQQQPLLDALEKNNLYGLLIQRAVVYGTSGTMIPRRFLTNDNPETQAQVTSFAVCGLMSMVVSWHQDGYTKSVSRMADLSVRVLCQPLFPNPTTII